MASNPQVSNNYTSTNPDYKVKTTEKSGNQVQHFILDVGVGETSSPVTTANPLPITGELAEAFYALRLEQPSDVITYIGKAVPGSANGDAAWQILKIDETSGMDIKWAEGTAAFDKVWSDRASYTYS